MEDRQLTIRKHVDGLFAETTPTRKSVELKEEMIQNLHDKYTDLIAEGKTDEAAYNIAIAGIGDISSLLAELEAEAEPLAFAPNVEELEKARRKSAMLTAIAVMMYILSFLPTMVMLMWGVSTAAELGIPIMFVMIAGATGLLIYNSMTRPKFKKRQDTVVEEFREWQSEEKDRKAMRKAVSSALWSIILALYFIVSFTLGYWHLTWLIFVGGAALQSLLNALFALGGSGKGVPKK